MSTTKDLGFLPLNSIRFESGLMIPDGKTQTDIYKFTTGSVAANVSFGTFISGFSSPSQSPFALALFKDSNNSGVLDNGDAFKPPVSDSGSGNREAFESISQTLTQGTYFARAQSFAFDKVDYSITFGRSSSGSANPLTNQEIPLGTIAQDLRRVDRVSDTDTADNFAFTLNGSSSLNINVKELGNKKGDANIRVVQDLDADGIVDKNEVVVKGISTDNADTITGLKGAGDYILQVCQSKGSTRFGVTFDHSAA